MTSLIAFLIGVCFTVLFVLLHKALGSASSDTKSKCQGMLADVEGRKLRCMLPTGHKGMHQGIVMFPTPGNTAYRGPSSDH